MNHCLRREDVLTLVAYGDYECSFCAAAQPILRDVRLRLGEALRFVFRHFPLPQVHPHAEHVAKTLVYSTLLMAAHTTTRGA